MPDSQYWLRVKEAAQKFSSVFSIENSWGQTTGLINNVLWVKDFNSIKADLTPFDCGALSVDFIFDMDRASDAPVCLAVKESGDVSWQVDSKGIRKIIAKQSGDKAIHFELFWDSGNPNENFYGSVTFVRVWLSEGNEVTIRHPWIMERVTLQIFGRMISDLLVTEGFDPISIDEKIDFDKTVEEVLKKSKISDLL